VNNYQPSDQSIEDSLMAFSHSRDVSIGTFSGRKSEKGDFKNRLRLLRDSTIKKDGNRESWEQTEMRQNFQSVVAIVENVVTTESNHFMFTSISEESKGESFAEIKLTTMNTEMREKKKHYADHLIQEK